MTKQIKHVTNFANEITTILSRCDLQIDSNTWRDTDIWKVSGKSDIGFFVIKKSALYYYFRCLDYVKEQLQKNGIKISENYLKKEFCNFLESLKRSNNDILTESKIWIDKLCKLQLKQFKLLIPINCYDYRNEINLGPIHIIKITDEILKQNFNVEELSEFYTASKLIKSNETDTFAIVCVESLEQEHAKESAYRFVEKFIHATKLIDSSSFIRLRKCSMIQVNEVILIEEKNKPLGYHSIIYPILDRINPKDDFYNDLQPYWDKLSTFLYTENPNDLQDVILSTLYWFGEVDVQLDSRVKLFLYYVSGLERIVLHDLTDTRQKAVPFGKRCSKIFHGNEKEFEFWKRYYWKRSNIIHKQPEYIYKEEINTLMIELRYLLLQLIDCTDRYNTIKDVFKNKFGIN